MKRLLAPWIVASLIFVGCNGIQLGTSIGPPPAPDAPVLDIEYPQTPDLGLGVVMFSSDSEILMAPASQIGPQLIFLYQRLTSSAEREGNPLIPSSLYPFYYTCHNESAMCTREVLGPQTILFNASDLKFPGGPATKGLGNPSFSADGMKLLVDAVPAPGKGADGYDIYSYNLSTEVITPLVTGTGIDQNAIEVPGGIVYQTGPPGVVLKFLATGVRRRPEARVKGSTKPVSLTEPNRASIDPAISPDGTKIVYSSRLLGDHRDLWVMNLDGSNKERLMNTPAAEIEPAWSPDGSHIVFVDKGSGDAPGDLFVINSDGTGRLPFTTGPSDEADPYWSDLPQNVANVMDRTEVEGNEGETTFFFNVNLLLEPTEPVTVDFATRDGSATAGIDYASTSGTLTFQPGVKDLTIEVPVDGDTDVETNESFYLDLSNANGAEVGRRKGKALIKNDDVSASPSPSASPSASPSVSPSASPSASASPSPSPSPGLPSLIAFARDFGGGSSQIFTMAPDGSGQLHVSPDVAGFLLFPEWSPDALKLIFNETSSGTNNILERPSDGSGTSTTLVSDPSDDLGAVYRPTGENGFVWASSRDGDYDIYYATPSTVGTPKNLTNNTVDDRSPNFSPDGTKVVYSSADGADRDIYQIGIDADGDPVSGPLNVSQEGVGDGIRADDFPEFSPDGTKIAYNGSLAGNEDIFVMNLDTNDRTQITSGSEFEVDPTWSPDGTQLAYVKEVGGNVEIFVITAAAGQTGVNITNNAANDWDPAWSSALTPARRRGSSPRLSASVMLVLGPLLGYTLLQVRRIRRRSNRQP
jgi:Tol biopolymer transport system component